MKIPRIFIYRPGEIQPPENPRPKAGTPERYPKNLNFKENPPN